MKDTSLEKSNQLKNLKIFNSVYQTNKLSKELLVDLPSFGVGKVLVKASENFSMTKECITLPALPTANPIKNSQYWELRVVAPSALYMKEDHSGVITIMDQGNEVESVGCNLEHIDD
jgi:hypothetical protein